MIRQAAADGRTKAQVVSPMLAGRETYVRKLVSDIVYAKVVIPSDWRKGPEATVLALDSAALLDAEQAALCCDLTQRALALIDIVVTLVRAYVDDLPPAARLQKNDLDSLRRGRGPTAVRDLLFRCLPYWPEMVPWDLGEDVDQVLDDVRSARQASQAAPTRTLEEMRGLLGPVLEPTREFVLEWARSKKLPREATEQVVSEAIDQLYRSVAKIGQAPRDLRRWSLATAAKKWQAMAARSLGAPTSSLDPEDAEARVVARDTVGDEASAAVDLNRWMHAAAAELRRLARAYAAEEPALLDDALSCDVAADLLELCDVDVVIAVVKGTATGAQAVNDRLARRGRSLSPDRRIAVQRLIEDTLRIFYDGNQRGD